MSKNKNNKKPKQTQKQKRNQSKQVKNRKTDYKRKQPEFPEPLIDEIKRFKSLDLNSIFSSSTSPEITDQQQRLTVQTKISIQKKSQPDDKIRPADDEISIEINQSDDKIRSTSPISTPSSETYILPVFPQDRPISGLFLAILRHFLGALSGNEFKVFYTIVSRILLSPENFSFDYLTFDNQQSQKQLRLSLTNSIPLSISNISFLTGLSKRRVFDQLFSLSAKKLIDITARSENKGTIFTLTNQLIESILDDLKDISDLYIKGGLISSLLYNKNKHINIYNKNKQNPREVVQFRHHLRSKNVITSEDSGLNSSSPQSKNVITPEDSGLNSSSPQSKNVITPSLISSPPPEFEFMFQAIPNIPLFLCLLDDTLSKISGNDFKVLFYILMHSILFNSPKTIKPISITTLTEICSLSRQTALDSIKHLCDKNIIQKFKYDESKGTEYIISYEYLKNLTQSYQEYAKIYTKPAKLEIFSSQPQQDELISSGNYSWHSVPVNIPEYLDSTLVFQKLSELGLKEHSINQLFSKYELKRIFIYYIYTIFIKKYYPARAKNPIGFLIKAIERQYTLDNTFVNFANLFIKKLDEETLSKRCYEKYQKMTDSEVREIVNKFLSSEELMEKHKIFIKHMIDASKSENIKEFISQKPTVLGLVLHLINEFKIIS